MTEPVQTPSGIPLEPVYGPAERAGDPPAPGEYPFTRGNFASGYRGKTWTFRQYSGFGTAEESNRRYRYLLDQGGTGLSVALDLPMRGSATQSLVDALNHHVLEAGGRIYLAKDALTRREDFAAMEPRLAAFDAVRRQWDPERRLRSALSVRLLGDAT